MEVLTLGGLLGIGYIISKAFPKKKTTDVMSSGTSNIQQNEGFVTQDSIVNPIRKGASATGPGPELDMMYQSTGGQTYPSEPNPGPHGSAFGYGTQQPPLSPAQISPEMKPELQPIQSNVPLMEFRSDNIEQEPQYMSGEYIVSPLSGERIPSSEYKHNNMQPFFGGRVKQNTGHNANKGILDAYNGSASLQLKKQEVETMFNTTQTPYGNPFGMEDNTDFFQSRIDQPNRRNSERPFEPVRVGPGVGEKFGLSGKGGFQQFDINEIMRPKTSDELRVATNPKEEYTQPVVPGAHYIGSGSDNTGEVRKYRPERFYTDETGERYFTTTGSLIKESVRSVQVLPHTTRPETTTERIGTASAQDINSTYVAGSYRTPMTQQYGGGGYRNASLEGYTVADPEESELADYGRNSFESRANERSETSERVSALNLAPADTGNVSLHYKDDARPTRRSEADGSLRTAGTPGCANGVPTITVWDPRDIARTTVKESTIFMDKFGIASSASAPTRLKVYDPEDVAKATQKSKLSNNIWYGPSMSAAQDSVDTTAAQNMRTNPGREQVARLSRPMAGAGEKAIFSGNHGSQTTHRIDTDSINARTPVITRPTGLPPGAGDLGRVEYRVPLNLDVSRDRNTSDMISAVENNPLQQSIQRNATSDERRMMH